MAAVFGTSASAQVNAWRLDDGVQAKAADLASAAPPCVPAARQADGTLQHPAASSELNVPERVDGADRAIAEPRVAAVAAPASALGHTGAGPSRRAGWLAGFAAVGLVLLAAATLQELGRGRPKPRVADASGVAAPAAHPAEALLPSWLSSAGQRSEPPAPSLPGTQQLLQRATTAAGTPEDRLLRVYGLIASGNSMRALDEARRLSQDVPNFALANLAYADLLNSRSVPLASFGAVPPALVTAASAAASTAGRWGSGVIASAPSQALHDSPASTGSSVDLTERLKDLSAEARARVGIAAFTPPPGGVPSQFLFLGPNVRHAIAVDTTRSRLYLFENTANGLVLKRDYYASVGKLGTAKRIEGDMRTPLGVYFITGRLSRARLADRYGASALVLNYPNQYDLIRGRTGSGIWLHGVESTSFSRAPLATDGCVALSNPDLLALTSAVDRQSTPVVIADRLEWMAAAQNAKLPEAFAQAFEVWRSARQQADPAAELALYTNAHADAYASLLQPTSAGGSPQAPWRGAPAAAAAAVLAETAATAAMTTSSAASGGHGTTPANWIDLLRAERSRPGSAAAQLTRLSVLAWHDRDDVMLVTYTETTSRDASPRLRRQYWLRRDSVWGIVFDGAVG